MQGFTQANFVDSEELAEKYDVKPRTIIENLESVGIVGIPMTRGVRLYTWDEIYGAKDSQGGEEEVDGKV